MNWNQNLQSIAILYKPILIPILPTPNQWTFWTVLCWRSFSRKKSRPNGSSVSHHFVSRSSPIWRRFKRWHWYSSSFDRVIFLDLQTSRYRSARKEARPKVPTTPFLDEEEDDTVTIESIVEVDGLKLVIIWLLIILLWSYSWRVNSKIVE